MAGKFSYSGSSVPRITTIKYEDVYGGIPVNLGINIAIWLVSLVRVAAVSSCITIKHEDVYGGIPVNLVINITVWLVSLVTVAAVSLCQPRITTFKYEDVCGGILVNLVKRCIKAIVKLKQR